MNSHVLIVGALIFAGMAFFALLIWKAIKTTEYRNDDEWKNVVTKARAFSSLTLWVLFLSWATIISFVKNDLTFTLSNLRTMLVILLGIQCLLELMAGLYHEKKLEK